MWDLKARPRNSTWRSLVWLLPILPCKGHRLYCCFTCLLCLTCTCKDRETPFCSFCSCLKCKVSVAFLALLPFFFFLTILLLMSLWDKIENVLFFWHSVDIEAWKVNKVCVSERKVWTLYLAIQFAKRLLKKEKVSKVVSGLGFVPSDSVQFFIIIFSKTFKYVWPSCLDLFNFPAVKWGWYNCLTGW